MRQNFHAPVPTHFYELTHSELVAVHIGMKLNRQLTNRISLVCVNIWTAARIVAPSSKYRSTNSSLHLHVFRNALLIRQAYSRCLCFGIWADEVETFHVQRTCGYNCTDKYSAFLSLRISLANRPNTVRNHGSLREVAGFPGGAAEYSARIMGYDVSARHTVLVFKGRNFQGELRSSIPEDDIRLPRNVGVRLPSEVASYARSTEFAMSIWFTYGMSTLQRF